MKHLPFISLILFGILIISIHVSKKPLHFCNWEDCNYKNKSVTVDNFKSTWGYEEGTDGFYIELTHIAQPHWTYEECEDYVFSQP